MKKIFILCILLLTNCSEKETDFVRYVNPFIGTKGWGNVIPGALVPHGSVKLSPDTDAEPLSVESYDYDHKKIEGFSHTHLEGPGGGGYGYSQILLMPGTGEIKTDESGYSSVYKHETENASLGYYSVMLDDSGVRAELTATEHCGVHRYTFPKSDNAHIIADSSHSRGECVESHIQIEGNTIVKGYSTYNIHPLISLVISTETEKSAISTIYFYILFSKPFKSYGTWNSANISPKSAKSDGGDIGAFVEFDTEENEVIVVKAGISSIDVEQAKKNLEIETAGKDFDEIRREASGKWNRLLRRIQVQGGTDEQKTVFYTALYHSFFQPTDYTEYGRYWIGADGKGHVVSDSAFHFYSDDFCVWDTFRTTHPLQILVEPETRNFILQSYVREYEEGGWIPKCSWHATGNSRIMIGNHAFSVIADAYLKGFKDFDINKAYEGMKKGSMNDSPHLLSEGGCGFFSTGTPEDYLKLGYVPVECDSIQSVSLTLEHAYDDFCVAQTAKLLGKSDDYEFFSKRSKNYTNNFNPVHGFMQEKDRNGNFMEPFDPEAAKGFCEADSWKYTWFVPHDVQGLIELIGGKDKFNARLDEFFEKGHYSADNEPDFHVPYLYVYSGEPWKTQKIVRELMQKYFTGKPDGLPGNDDAGATSSWYVLSAMGLYPVSPGHGIYIIGSPVFDRISIRLDPLFFKAKEFVIEAKNNSPENVYIQTATLNGMDTNNAWITHDEISQGGTLRLVMGKNPSQWGSTTPP